MTDFEREMLTNAHVHAAVEAGRRAAFELLKRGGTWEVDDESDETAYQMAQQLSAAVVEAVRSGVNRESAHRLRLQAERMSTPLPGDVVRRDAIQEAAQRLDDWAEAEDDQHRQQHQHGFGLAYEFGLAVDLKRIADALRGDLP